MSDEEKEAQLLTRLDGGAAVGNLRLIRELGRELGWPEEQYWYIRNRLVDRGDLQVGRGRGGTIRLSTTPMTPLVPSPAPGGVIPTPDDCSEAEERLREIDLYRPIAGVLESKWVKDKRFEQHLVHITAQQGRRTTGGRWTRPDITIAALSTYSYVPGRHFDVVTFEIKPSDAIDVTAVYEALAHLRAATKAYVLLHVPTRDEAALEEVIIDVQGEAKKHGVGLILAANPDDYETWEERVEPRRFEPEPQRLNDFLANQLTKDQLERLVRWFR